MKFQHDQESFKFHSLQRHVVEEIELSWVASITRPPRGVGYHFRIESNIDERQEICRRVTYSMIDPFAADCPNAAALN